ncbi:50S ribosomal protein L25 [Bacteroidales bacterium OttesenSCG-928-B11]|nr:50S ribosomal protein L25 [Bacteroidales bacterium OttesenSCG-928-E04]MDL2311356.1 50S ribosomal protein L25 [Bacteroidales bacterium OttesenSCG-928-B11]
MKSVSISGSLRENVGKKDAKAQRVNGMVPCVLYGGKQQYQFVVPEEQFRKLLYTPEVRYAELTVGDRTCNAIVQATQFHPISDKLLHVDFLEVIDGKPITIDIPIKITGTSPGVLRGGKLAKKVRKLKVKGELKDIPENIMVDISNLEINDTFKIGNLGIDKIQFMESPNKIILSILTTRNVEASAENEG